MVLEAKGKNPEPKCLEILPAQMATFVRAHVMLGKFSGNADTEKYSDATVADAAHLGLPDLREEALEFMETWNRVGNFNPINGPGDMGRVYFGAPSVGGRPVVSSMVSRGRNWKAADCGDAIPADYLEPV